MQQLLLLTAWILAGGLSVNVAPVEGPTYQAELSGANSDSLSLIVDGQQRQVPLAELQSVVRSPSDERVNPAIRATLRDGTQLPVDDIQIEGQQAKLKLRRQGTFTVPVRNLSRIRFRPPSAHVDAQWAGYVKQSKPDDQLVIRRDTDTLDAVGGAVKAINEQLVQFELDGAPVDAPFNRLEGIVFAGQEPSDAAPAKLRVKDVYGATWNARGLEAGSTEGTLIVATAGGLQHEIRIDLIESIELSSGSLFVASLEPVDQTYQPFIATPELIAAENRQAWLGPRVQDNHTLVMPSKSVITYRIEPGFNRFVADVQIDPSVTLGGACGVRVLLNENAAWEQTLTIGEQAQHIDIPLSDASRLTLEVNFGDDGDIGDIVHVREPRFLK